jgi:hypothetical protein
LLDVSQLESAAAVVTRTLLTGTTMSKRVDTTCSCASMTGPQHNSPSTDWLSCAARSDKYTCVASVRPPDTAAAESGLEMGPPQSPASQQA